MQTGDKELLRLAEIEPAIADVMPRKNQEIERLCKRARELRTELSSLTEDARRGVNCARRRVTLAAKLAHVEAAIFSHLQMRLF